MLITRIPWGSHNYYITQNFDGRKLADCSQEHFGGKNFGRLVAVHRKSARTIVVGG